MDPSIPQLEHKAKFQVGDRVYYFGSTDWVVTGRYWSPSKGCIVYDVRDDRTGTTIREKEPYLSAAQPRRE